MVINYKRFQRDEKLGLKKRAGKFPPLSNRLKINVLLQKLQHQLRRLIGLRQHRLCGLLYDVPAGEIRRRSRVIRVFNTTAGLCRLGGDIEEVIASKLKATDHGAHLGALEVDLIESRTDGAQRAISRGGRRDDRGQDGA